MGGRNSETRGNPSAMIAVAILAPVAATIVQMAISRSREYLADASGAQYAGDPVPLASALAKLNNMEIPMDANPATEGMFIVKPFTPGAMQNLFSTHPSAEDRIQRLIAMRKR